MIDLDYETVIRTEIFAEGNVVCLFLCEISCACPANFWVQFQITPKLLSRRLDISVSKAREYLESFHKTTQSAVHVTYVVTGNVKKFRTVDQVSCNSKDFHTILIDKLEPVALTNPENYSEFTISIVPEEKLKGI